MRHSRRTTLTTDDVDGALKLRNVEVSVFCCLGTSIHLVSFRILKNNFFYNVKAYKFVSVKLDSCLVCLNLFIKFRQILYNE